MKVVLSILILEVNLLLSSCFLSVEFQLGNVRMIEMQASYSEISIFVNGINMFA